MSEREIICEDLSLALDDFRRKGFQLDVIYPADAPHTAFLSSGDEIIRLTTQPGALGPSSELPPFRSEFTLTHAGADAGAGRAGMLYRDLIPNRVGGRYIASHIAIPDGGPVADWVHYHRIAFQLIVVRSGWVRVVYEDQGEPFVTEAGDMVLQPPAIRHRVLESSPGLEVVEITCPALHETFADHDICLPNGQLDLNRSFGGQRFLRHVARETPWVPMNGGESQETSICNATAGLADARIIKSAGRPVIEFPGHDGELVFGFVLGGSAQLEFGDHHALGPADAFVIPPGGQWSVRNASADFRLLHVTTSRLG